VDRQGESRCLGANEEEARGNPSGLAVTIFRAAFRSRIYVSNRETYPALTKALQKGGVHIHPYMVRGQWLNEADFCIEALKEAIAKYGVPEIMNSDYPSLGLQVNR